MFKVHAIIIMFLLYELGGLLGWHNGPIIGIDQAAAAVRAIRETLAG